MVNPAIGGMTDWVVTFPTKRAHVDTTRVVRMLLRRLQEALGWALQMVRHYSAGPKRSQRVKLLGIMQYDREEQGSSWRSGLKFSLALRRRRAKSVTKWLLLLWAPAGTASALSVDNWPD